KKWGVRRMMILLILMRSMERRRPEKKMRCHRRGVKLRMKGIITTTLREMIALTRKLKNKLRN
ncbi:unnamed protein product, partial [Cochlearia groenlandica]